MTGRDQSTLGLGLSESRIEGANLSAWLALSDILADRGARIPALVPALGGHVARVVVMTGGLVIAFVLDYCSGRLE